MSTEKQIAANQANAQFSTGPKSAEGKAAVSQNRTTHGLNYNAATFCVLPCEDQSDYDNLLQSLIDEQKPANTIESLLVVSMAQHRWLRDRAHRLQETCFNPETGQIADPKMFALYLRYANTNQRAFRQCLNDLLKLRNQTRKLAIGFESSTGRKAAAGQSNPTPKSDTGHLESPNSSSPDHYLLAKQYFERHLDAQKAA